MSCRDQRPRNLGGGLIEIPNCDDPVFRMWCAACALVPGKLYGAQDVRVAELEAMMQRHQPDYDPYQDPADDYLTEDL